MKSNVLDYKENKESFILKQKAIYFDVGITSPMFGLKKINKNTEHLEIIKLKQLGFGTLGQLALLGLYLNGSLYKDKINPVISFFNGSQNIGSDRLEMAQIIKRQILDEGVNEKILDEILRIACRLAYCKNDDKKSIQLQSSFDLDFQKQHYVSAIIYIKDFIKIFEESDKNPIVCCDIIGLIPIFKLKELALQLLINFGLIDEITIFEQKCNEMVKRIKRKKDKNIYSLVEKKEIKEFLELIIDKFESKAGIKSKELVFETSSKIDKSLR